MTETLAPITLDRAMLYCGDSRDVLPVLEPEQFTACVCDAPYHLTQASRRGSPRSNDPKTPFGRTRLGSKGFMGKTWDGGDVAFRPEFWDEVLRVLKPGAMLLAFGGTRTFHRLTCAIEDAGFEIRDCLMWLYGSGMPKAYNLRRAGRCECSDQEKREHEGPESRAQTRGRSQSGLEGREACRAREGLRAGSESHTPSGETERLRVGAHSCCREDAGAGLVAYGSGTPHQPQSEQQPARESSGIQESQGALVEGALRGRGACPQCGKLLPEFAGYGSALKPAWEPIVLAMKAARRHVRQECTPLRRRGSEHRRLANRRRQRWTPQWREDCREAVR